VRPISAGFLAISGFLRFFQKNLPSRKNKKIFKTLKAVFLFPSQIYQPKHRLARWPAGSVKPPFLAPYWAITGFLLEIRR